MESRTHILFASLSYGALLGSYRHHGIIPWDDVVDVQVNVSNRFAMLEAFNRFQPEYGLYPGVKRRLKFCNMSGNKLRKEFQYRTPFVDVSFYRNNETHLWDLAIRKQRPFLMSTIFPLRDRPFLGRMYPAPRDPLANLKVTYKPNICYTGGWNHVKETVKHSYNTIKINCSDILHVIPFVTHYRCPGQTSCMEVLRFNGQILKTFIRNGSDIPEC